MKATRAWEAEELRNAAENSEITWNSCVIQAQGAADFVSFEHLGKDGAPDAIFIFRWDEDEEKVSVGVFVYECSGCEGGHPMSPKEVIWVACPPPSWGEACEQIAKSYREYISRKVLSD